MAKNPHAYGCMLAHGLGSFNASIEFWMRPPALRPAVPKIFLSCSVLSRIHGKEKDNDRLYAYFNVCYRAMSVPNLSSFVCIDPIIPCVCALDVVVATERLRPRLPRRKWIRTASPSP